MVVIINLRFGVGWTSDRNGGWWRAAPRGAAPHLWTKCPEVGQTKCACATQSHASARNYISIYVLPNCTFTAGLILLGGWAFFDKLAEWKMDMDTAAPPIAAMPFHNSKYLPRNSGFEIKTAIQQDKKTWQITLPIYGFFYSAGCH